MAECKYDYEGFCVNDDCPYRADFCPVGEFPEVCKYCTIEGETE